DPETGVSRLYFKPAIRFNPAEFETHQVFFTSKDGTRIPMTITHRRGLYRHDKNPTLLYGYGGFNISITPSFSTATALWLMQGGVYAVPNLRGGGEYGRDWHEAGTQHQKQNVFDDFIAAAEYLIDQGYTSPDYLAVQGRSNGGLLVGAIMTQRPDLMKVALPGVGVMDMLRYHEFTAGAGWSFDYGRSDESPAMFQTLLAYSPLHNIKPGQTYPATLITTGDHDDRVVPAHSFKFAATLQAAQTGKAPTLIRIETDAGHGAGTSIEKRIDEVADTLGFALYNMGITQIDKPINE
ncbi:MAG: prolyl oligopeptidase family serine peptidase, partial [Pseudomonadales bacterium]